MIIECGHFSFQPAPPPVGSPAYDELEKVAEAEADGTSTVSILEASMITLSVPGGLVFKENITTAQEGAVFPSVPTLHTTDVAVGGFFVIENEPSALAFEKHKY